MKIPIYTIGKGTDGVYRVTIDDHGLEHINIHKSLEEQTGIKWDFYGHFMDHDCYGTQDKKIEKYALDNNISLT